MLQGHFQQTITTTSAHLAQTMTLLSQTNSELQQTIETELSNNPALELIEDRFCPMCRRALPPTGPCPICSQPKDYASQDPIVFISPREDFYTGSTTMADEIPDEPFASESVDLPTYVLRQIAGDLAVQDRMLAAYILNHLDDDGFLTTNAIEVAHYFHRPAAEVQSLIDRLKRCEPVGVCAADPKDAMLTQIEVLAETTTIPEHTREIILSYLPKLSQHHYSEIAREFGVSTAQIQHINAFIGENLNPFPARAHWGDVRNPNSDDSQVFHQPDILVYHLNENPRNPLVVEIILPIRGTLRVNPLFKATIKQLDAEKAEEWKGDVEKATLLIKCIQQRSNALKMLLEKLVLYQKNFILQGEKEMQPLTRAEIAKQLEVHESTISRAVSGKTIQLPNKRIVPLSVFFDRSLSQRTLIKEMIENEVKPLSDSEIQMKLKEHGIEIARRTVAKYRSVEGILPAHLRQARNR
jgi:RNA polymerase sigma-54 factor